MARSSRTLSGSWSELRLKKVSKRFGAAPWVLKDVDLLIEKGSFVCVLGPSGCGKSTLLDLLAGFEQASEGVVSFDDRPIRKPGPDRVVIFQDISNALFPWLTVLENVEFGLRGTPTEQRHKLARDTLALVGLTEHERKFPSELSGGMKQRAQIARGLVMDPDVLLMDEPFGALDAMTRQNLQLELKALWARTGKTIVFITHDSAEALTLASDIVVMSPGPNAHIVDMFRPDLSSESGPADPSWVSAHNRLRKCFEHSAGKSGSK